MNPKHNAESLIAGVLGGDRITPARCLCAVDDDASIGGDVAAGLSGHIKGQGHIIGITGNPGAGKSTVVDKLITELRAEGHRVAVLCIDPSSPFSGGAILGDRIRMQKHFADDKVFIRSLATRGAHGGLSRSTFDSVRVFEAAGFDRIIIETVGVGQDEVDVVRLAQTTIVIMVPGLGDDIQAIKAGLLEIADIFCVNKADRPGAEDVKRSLHSMMALGVQSVGSAAEPSWRVPIVSTVASQGQGVKELLADIALHAEFLRSDAGSTRRQRRQHALFNVLLDSALVDAGRTALGGALQAAEADITSGQDPFSVLQGLLPH